MTRWDKDASQLNDAPAGTRHVSIPASAAVAALSFHLAASSGLQPVKETILIIKNNQVLACEYLLCRSSTDQTRIIAATGVNNAWRTVGGEKVPSRWLSTWHRRKATSSPPANISTAPHTTNYNNRSEIKRGQWQRHGCTCSEEHVRNDTVLVSEQVRRDTRARSLQMTTAKREKKTHDVTQDTLHFHCIPYQTRSLGEKNMVLCWKGRS